MSAPAIKLFSAPRNVPKLSSVTRSWRALNGSKLSARVKSRSLATVTSTKGISDASFTGSSPKQNFPNSNGQDPQKPNDERTVNLGKTLRVIQARLPTLLQSPLPQEILSPSISLHLFPSTHPHLPTVSGRVAYSAALWTSPIAWGRLPIVGNVKLKIISERMVKPQDSHYCHTVQNSTYNEQLVVRWSTIGKTKYKGTGAFYKGIRAGENVDKITEWLGGGKGEDDKKEFTGLFIFEFDDQGRISSHTIEHVQHGGDWEQGVGARFVGLTDWLLGGMKRQGDEGSPCPAFWTGRDDNRKHGSG